MGSGLPCPPDLGAQIHPALQTSEAPPPFRITPLSGIEASTKRNFIPDIKSALTGIVQPKRAAQSFAGSPVVMLQLALPFPAPPAEPKPPSPELHRFLDRLPPHLASRLTAEERIA